MNRSSKISCIIFIALIGVTFFINPSISSAKAIKWRAQSAYPAGLIFYEAAVNFAERVKVMSNGELDITMNAGGVLVPSGKEADAVSKGALDLSCSSPMMQRGKFPAGAIIGAGIYSFKQHEFMAWFEVGGGYELWQEMYDRKKYNVKVLPSYGIYGMESLGWFNKPIKSLADFKGLKYRTVGEWGEVLTRVGASVMTLPAGELYTALERGVLDGTDMSIPSFDKGLGLYEICKYLLLPGVHQTSGPMETLVNKNSWAKLSPDLQAIVKSAARETSTVETLCQWTKKDADALEFFKTKGVKILTLSPEVLREIKVLFDEVLDERAKKYPFYAKVLKSQRKFHKRWGDYQKLQSW